MTDRLTVGHEWSLYCFISSVWSWWR